MQVAMSVHPQAQLLLDVRNKSSVLPDDTSIVQLRSMADEALRFEAVCAVAQH